MTPTGTGTDDDGKSDIDLCRQEIPLTATAVAFYAATGMKPRCNCTQNSSNVMDEIQSGLRELELDGTQKPEMGILPGSAVGPKFTTPSQTFPFMRLPTELRITVYEMRFQHAKEPGTMGQHCPAGDHCRNRVCNDKPVRMLFMVSRYVRAEAMDVYYSPKHFKFNSVFSLGNFLSVIGQEQRNHLRTLTVTDITGFATSNGFTQLGTCAALKHLNIIILNDQEVRKLPDLLCKRGALGLFESVRGLDQVTLHISGWPVKVGHGVFVNELRKSIARPREGSSGDAHHETLVKEWEEDTNGNSGRRGIFIVMYGAPSVRLSEDQS